LSKPTQEQVKKLWEWCGFERLPEGKKNYHFERGTGDFHFLAHKVMNWQAPDGSIMPYLPSPTLDSLFQWATRELAAKGIDGFEAQHTVDGWHWEISDGLLDLAAAEDQDPALALFWAIWQVIE